MTEKDDDALTEPPGDARKHTRKSLAVTIGKRDDAGRQVLRKRKSPSAGASETMAARLFDPEHVSDLGRRLLPDGHGAAWAWREGFEAAADVYGNTVLALARALDRWAGVLTALVDVRPLPIGHRDVVESGLTLAQCEAWLTAHGWTLTSRPDALYRCWSKAWHADRWIFASNDQWPHQQAACIAVLIEALADADGVTPRDVLAEMLSIEEPR